MAKITFDEAMANKSAFAKKSGTASTLRNYKVGDTIKATVTGYRQSERANSEGNYFLQILCVDANNLPIHFNCSDPETELQKLPIGTKVDLTKGEFEVEATDRESGEVLKNEDGSTKMRIQAFTSVKKIYVNSAPLAAEVGTDNLVTEKPKAGK